MYSSDPYDIITGKITGRTREESDPRSTKRIKGAPEYKELDNIPADTMGHVTGFLDHSELNSTASVNKSMRNTVHYLERMYGRKRLYEYLKDKSKYDLNRIGVLNLVLTEQCLRRIGTYIDRKFGYRFDRNWVIVPESIEYGQSPKWSMIGDTDYAISVRSAMVDMRQIGVHYDAVLRWTYKDLFHTGLRLLPAPADISDLMSLIECLDVKEFPRKYPTTLDKVTANMRKRERKVIHRLLFDYMSPDMIDIVFTKVRDRL